MAGCTGVHEWEKHEHLLDCDSLTRATSICGPATQCLPRDRSSVTNSDSPLSFSKNTGQERCNDSVDQGAWR